MSYSGLVTKIKVQPHPNAEKLALGMCGPYQVVVGKDTPDGQLGVFFAVDGQLSEAFAKQHDLVERIGEDGKRAGGYFSKNRKVRCQKLRGEKSEGFFMPITCLEFTGVDLDTLKEGDPITVVNGVEICRKYYTPATRHAMGNRAVKAKKECRCFHKHLESGQFKREASDIPAGAILHITEKLHGTSHRVGYVLDEVPLELPFWKRWINKFVSVFHTMKEEYSWLNGSRNIVLEHKGMSADNPAGGYYGNDGFRFKMTDPLKGLLRKGETIFGEIVGFTGNGDAPIMGRLPVKDKEDRKKYGDQMTFSYGCKVGTCEFYVYRITMTNEDGHSVDLSPEAMVQRCKKLGLKTVPYVTQPFVYDGDLEKLRELVEGNYVHGESLLDSTHIREGVCIRWEGESICRILKAKSFKFLGFEDEQKSSDSFVDTEEVS